MKTAAAIMVAAVIGASPATADPRDPLAGRVAGPPQRCIDLSFGTTATVVDPRTILYERTRRRIWTTRPDASCPMLRAGSTLVTEVTGRRLCRGDRFRVVYLPTRIASAYCRFAGFVPYDRAR